MSLESPPEILDVRTVATSRLFEIEAVDLRFSNGVEVGFERLKGSAAGAVLVVPITTEQDVVLIREYACGTERYELGLPKGRVEPGEALMVAANRELMEEAGFGAEQFDYLAELTSAPTYSGQRTHVVIATGLYPARLSGDEPEPLEVLRWPLADIDQLALAGHCTEARSIAALYMARAHLAAKASG
ncbi:ADP compounds hydrolase NudE [Halothiobacillus diazotrophicus]|uniref:ADP compounds hydrolase NudE n=1 Tax=Halothiobacillus diazotrophicus TaxID=1860122 RepID=A0A191ZKI0_9GAMM|nr:ADP compounds hydrolase NudE [Halothiobacillus diazotrophicus]ANJ68411.1 ADP compounds hydrolase NudE [Halothiobacillus diazotrophicus]